MVIEGPRSGPGRGRRALLCGGARGGGRRGVQVCMCACLCVSSPTSPRSSHLETSAWPTPGAQFELRAGDKAIFPAGFNCTCVPGPESLRAHCGQALRERFARIQHPHCMPPRCNRAGNAERARTNKLSLARRTQLVLPARTLACSKPAARAYLRRPDGGSPGGVLLSPCAPSCSASDWTRSPLMIAEDATEYSTTWEGSRTYCAAVSVGFVHQPRQSASSGRCSPSMPALVAGPPAARWPLVAFAIPWRLSVTDRPLWGSGPATQLL